MNQRKRKCKRALFLKIDRWMLNAKVALSDVLHMREVIISVRVTWHVTNYWTAKSK